MSTSLLHPRFDTSSGDIELALLRCVNRALDLDPALDVSDVDVVIDGDRVTLVGSVPGMATRRRIELTVGRVAGVRMIDNQLGLGPSSDGASWSMRYVA